MAHADALEIGRTTNRMLVPCLLFTWAANFLLLNYYLPLEQKDKELLGIYAVHETTNEEAHSGAFNADNNKMGSLARNVLVVAAAVACMYAAVISRQRTN